MGAVDIQEATVRIRALQAMYSVEHLALVNWGLWSMDRSGLFPTVSRPSVWDQFKRSEGDDYGEEKDHAERIQYPGPAKSEAPEREPYDERAAVILDERMHHPGGLAVHVREAIRVAYVSREVPDEQFPRLTGCSVDAFCERLEGALLFVGRFV